VQRTVESHHPIDLGLTLGGVGAGSRDPSVRVGRDEAWLATRTPDGPATLHLSGRGHRLDAEAWGPGAAWALDHAPATAGAEDDLGGFDPAGSVVRSLHRRFTGLRIPRTGRVVEALLRLVVAQKVTGKEAKGSYRRMASAFGEEAPGRSGLLLPPDPGVLAGLAYHRMHRFGIERIRAERIIEVCRRASRLAEAETMPLPEAYARIRALPGIGPWTAAGVGLVALGDADAVLVGDYNLPNTVAWVLAGEPRADDRRMLELLEPYSGHRGRVVKLIKAAGLGAPRFGPRRPTRSIEGI
jgi:3-methyladenine DNA glycosylase/8-oxoguanine DNA glycosylase